MADESETIQKLTKEIAALKKKIEECEAAEREHKETKARLEKLEWMLFTKESPADAGEADGHDQGYGDLTALNQDGLVLKSIGREHPGSLANDYLELLGTSSAIYEINGDYAFGIFYSGWCRMMDRASRQLCTTSDNVEALSSGRWLCHESCWTDCSRKAIAEGAPLDIACNGGIRLYAVPIVAHGNVVGAINFGYGDPPTDPERLRRLADTYNVTYDDCVREAHAYDVRPPFIVELAKRRLHATARLIGSMIETKQAPEALQESEKRYRLLADNSADVIWTMTLDGRFTYVSPSVLRLSGHTPEEVLVIPFHDFVVESYVTPVMNEIAVQLAKPPRDRLTSYTMELQIYCKDGSIKDIEVSVSWLLDEQGHPAGIQGNTRDITDRKRAGEALRESELFMRETQQIAKLGGWKTNPRTDYLEWNDGVYEIIEEPRDYRPGLAEGVKYYGSEYLPALQSGLERCLTTGDPFTLEAEIITAKGNHRWVDVRAFARSDDRGVPLVMGTIQDITERKRAEEAMRTSEEKFRHIFEKAEEGISIVREEVFEFINPAFQRILGHSIDTLTSVPFESFMRYCQILWIEFCTLRSLPMPLPVILRR